MADPPQPRRILVAGTGSIGRRHIANARDLWPDVAIALVRRDGQTDDYSRSLDARVFAGWGHAARWEPEIAVIATPSDAHLAPLAFCLDRGVAALIEKPVVASPAELAAVERLIATKSVMPPTQVGCVLRFLPAVRRLQALLREGVCGTVVRATFECGQYLPDWRPGSDHSETYSAHVARGGGVILDLIHEIDLAFALFGDCTLEHAVAERRCGLTVDSEDVALLTLRGSNGVPVQIALDYVSRTPRRSVTVIGDRATAHLDFIGRSLKLVWSGGVAEEWNDGFDTAAAYRDELAELVGAWAGIATPTVPLDQALAATRLALSARSRAYAAWSLA